MTAHGAAAKWLCILAAALFGVRLVQADTVILANDDRITGQIVSLQGGKLTINTHYAGVVTVDWSAVKDIFTDENVRVTIKGGGDFRASIQTLEEQALLLRLFNGMRESVNLEKIEGINLPPKAPAPAAAPAAAPAPAAAAAAPPPKPKPKAVPWVGSLDLGVNSDFGNSKQQAVYLAATGDRTVGKRAWSWRTSLDLNKVGDADMMGKAKGMINHKSLLKKGLAQASFLEVEWDEARQLDFRSTAGLGLDWNAYQDKDTQLGFEGSFGYTREDYKTKQSDDITARVSARLGQGLWHKSRLDASLTVYPELEDWNDYRWHAEATWTQPLTPKLSLRLIANDDFVNRPPGKALKNDLRLRLALGLTY